MDDKVMAKVIVDAVGGVSNILDLTHCMTRLRFTLQDESIVCDTTVTSIEGVMGVVKQWGQYQIIVGDAVSGLYGVIGNIIKAADQ